LQDLHPEYTCGNLRDAVRRRPHHHTEVTSGGYYGHLRSAKYRATIRSGHRGGYDPERAGTGRAEQRSSVGPDYGGSDSGSGRAFVRLVLAAALILAVAREPARGGALGMQRSAFSQSVPIANSRMLITNQSGHFAWLNAERCIGAS
jgi:hypothetical protein